MKWSSYETQIAEECADLVVKRGASQYYATDRCYRTLCKSGYNRTWEACRSKIRDIITKRATDGLD